MRERRLENRGSVSGAGRLPSFVRAGRRRTLQAALVLWWLAGVCNAAQRPAMEMRAETYRISGVVVDAMTGAPVPGAELWTTGDVEVKTVADGEGRFAFEGVEAGKYPLNATAPGYVKEGYNQHGSFFTGTAVGSGLDSEHVVFKLHRQAVIYGRVSDERGDGVRRATVWLFAENVQYGKHAVTVQTQMQTNDLGAYRFAHLMPGKYYVGVMARPWWAEMGLKYQAKAQTDSGSGIVARSPEAVTASDAMFDVVYPVTFFAGATEDVGAVPLMAKAGDAIEANVQLMAVPSVHVLLTNMDVFKRKGQNLNVFAVQKPFGATNVPVNVNSTEIGAGVYEVGGLPPGEVRLSVNRGGDSEWDSHGIRLNAVEGESVDATTKTATSSVSGVVVAAEGSKEEIQGEVVLRSAEDEASSARLRKDGTFRIPAVEEGTYEVFVNTRRNGDYVAKVVGSGAKVTGRTVKIEGASEVRLTVTLGKGLGRVEGVVKMDGKAAAGAMVLMVPAAAGLSGDEIEQLVRMDQSDSDGTFTLGGVVPGKYLLLAIEDGWELEWKDESVLAPYQEKGVKVEIGAGEEKSVAVEGVKRREELKSEKVKP